MASDQEELLEELLGEGLMNKEEADGYRFMLEEPVFNLEDLVRASVREELEELVKEEWMSREKAVSYQEEMVRMRVRHFFTSSPVSDLDPGSLDIQLYNSLPEELLAAIEQERSTILVDLQGHDQVPLALSPHPPLPHHQ